MVCDSMKMSRTIGSGGLGVDLFVDQAGFHQALAARKRVGIVLPIAPASRYAGEYITSAEAIDDSRGDCVPGKVANQGAVGPRLGDKEIFDRGAGLPELQHRKARIKARVSQVNAKCA